MSILEHFKAVSKSRLSPYKKLCQNTYFNQNLLVLNQCSICVYTALQHRSAIFHSLIQEIEISVRNEIMRVIKHDLAKGDLIDYFCHLAIDNESKLSSYNKNELKKCLQKLINKKNPKVTYINNKDYTRRALNNADISSDDIIANLMFGFWINLIDNDAKRNKNYLYWNNLFYGKLFNDRFNSIKQLYNELRDVRDFRNRLSHQEAIWSKKSKNHIQALKNMEVTYKRFDCILEKLSPARHHLRKVSRYLSYQERLVFDIDIFNAEIDSMMSNLFII